MNSTGILKNRSEYNEINADHEFKIVLVGDCGVGKTSIFNRVKDGIFSNQTTIGLEHCSKYIYLENGDIVRLIIWDTAGQERYRTITKNYYRNCDAVLFVFAINDMGSFSGLMKWNDDVCHISGDEVSRILIGNKKDCTTVLHPRAVEDFYEVRHFVHYFNISALTGEGIDHMLTCIAKNLINKKDDSTETSSITFNSDSESTCYC